MVGFQKSTNDRTVTKVLPGGLYCLLGDNVYENGELKYQGRVGIKYGRTPKDWVRMSYNDLVIFVLWVQEHKDFINQMVLDERARGLAPVLE